MKLATSKRKPVQLTLNKTKDSRLAAYMRSGWCSVVSHDTRLSPILRDSAQFAVKSLLGCGQQVLRDV